MQSLVPFEPREAGPRAAAVSRLPWLLVAAAVTVAFLAGVFLHWRELFDLLRRHALLQAELAVSGGTIGGLLLARVDLHPILKRRLVMLERLYEQAAALPVRPMPGYTHYLPCVLLMVDDGSSDLPRRVNHMSEATVLRQGIGGVLYVGPDGTRFEPTVGVRREAPQAGSLPALAMRPLRQVTATPFPLPQTPAARLVRARPRHAVLVRWPEGQALMAIPSIGDTLPRLHNCLDALRWGAR